MQDSRSVTSPLTRSNSSPARPRTSLLGRRSALTRCPRASNSWTRFAPMKPDAPVTKQFIELPSVRGGNAAPGDGRGRLNGFPCVDETKKCQYQQLGHGGNG